MAISEEFAEFWLNYESVRRILMTLTSPPWTGEGKAVPGFLPRPFARLWTQPASRLPLVVAPGANGPGSCTQLTFHYAKFIKASESRQHYDTAQCSGDSSSPSLQYKITNAACRLPFSLDKCQLGSPICLLKDKSMQFSKPEARN